MNIQEWIEEALIEEMNGKSLLRLSLEVYLTEQLGMQILDVTQIKEGYEIEFRFTTTNGINEFVFENEFYDPEDFSPHQQVFILKEIRGKEGVLPTEHYIWLKRDNKADKYLTTPLAELMEGKQHDQELRFAVDYLKRAFQDVDGFEYQEEESNELSSFSISLNNEIILRQGFSNTIQCDFKKEAFSSFQIIFKGATRKEVTEELDSFIQFVHAYLAKDLTLDHHDIFALYTFLKKTKLEPQVQTNVLYTPKSETALLFKPLIIESDDIFSYHQIQVSIVYHYEKKSFTVEANYLFRTFVTECTTVDEVKRRVNELIGVLQNSKQEQVK